MCVWGGVASCWTIVQGRRYMVQGESFDWIGSIKYERTAFSFWNVINRAIINPDKAQTTILCSQNQLQISWILNFLYSLDSEIFKFGPGSGPSGPRPQRIRKKRRWQLNGQASEETGILTGKKAEERRWKDANIYHRRVTSIREEIYPQVFGLLTLRHTTHIPSWTFLNLHYKKIYHSKKHGLDCSVGRLQLWIWA